MPVKNKPSIEYTTHFNENKDKLATLLQERKDIQQRKQWLSSQIDDIFMGDRYQLCQLISDVYGVSIEVYKSDYFDDDSITIGIDAKGSDIREEIDFIFEEHDAVVYDKYVEYGNKLGLSGHTFEPSICYCYKGEDDYHVLIVESSTSKLIKTIKPQSGT